MGAFLSSEYLTTVTESLKIVQDNIVKQTTLGDASWLQVKDIQDRLDDIKILLYNKVCSKCKSKVKTILGETPRKKQNLINVLPPERQMLLRDLARSMVEMEISKSGNKDVSDADINLTLNCSDENWYAKKVEAHDATVEEYKKLLRDAEEKIRTVELERDELSISLINLKSVEKDRLQTDIEARTREGSKLQHENSSLVDKTVILQTQLDAQVKEVLRLRQENEEMSTILTEVQRKPGKETEVCEESDIPNLEEEDDLIEKENAKYVKKTTNSVEDERETVERGKLKRKLATLENGNETLNEKLIGIDKAKDQLELTEMTQGMEKQEIIDSLTEQIRQLQDENASYANKVDNATEKNKKLEKEMYEKSTSLSKTNSDLKTALNELAKEKQEVEETLNEQMRQLQDENASYANEIEIGKEENDRLKREMTEKITSLSNTNSDLEMTSKELAKEKQVKEDSLIEQIRQLQDENASYANKVENATKKINGLEKEMSEKITSLSNRNCDLEKASKELAKEKQQIEDSLNEQMRQLQDEIASHVNKMKNATEENNRLKTELTTSACEMETLNEEFTNLSKTKNEFEMLSKKLEKEQQKMEDSFNKQLRQLQDANTSYVKKCSEFTEEIRNLKRTLTTMSQSKNELEKIAKTMEKENEELGEQINDLKKVKETLSSSVSVLQQDNVKLRNDLSAIQEKMKSTRKEIEHNQEQNQQLEKEIVRHVTEIESSEREIKTLKTDLSNSDLHISRLQKDIATVTQSKDQFEAIAQTLEREKQEIRKTLTKQMLPLPDENEDILSIISGFQSYIDRLQTDLRTKTEELDFTVRELKEIKNRKKSVVLGLRTERSGMGKTMVTMVTKELTKRLHSILEREGIDVTIILCQTPDEVPNGPLVVLCLNMSRVGTNILSAVEGIKINQDVFALVLHNTIKDNLSLLTPTSLRITGSELRQLGGIMDMAFSSDSGVYDCDLNSSAVEKMATTLRKYAR